MNKQIDKQTNYKNKQFYKPWSLYKKKFINNQVYKQTIKQINKKDYKQTSEHKNKKTRKLSKQVS